MTAVDTTADNATAAGKLTAAARDSVKTVIAASMVGTAIEFYDFYAYGTAAANYFPTVFFSDTTNPTVALLPQPGHVRGRVHRPPGRLADLRATSVTVSAARRRWSSP